MFSPILVHDFLRQSAKLYPEKIAVICGDEQITYKNLNTASDHLSYELVNCGVNRQDRVVVFLDNCIESVISLYGILKAQSIFVIINGAIKPKKLAYILQDADARILISHTSKANVIKETFKTINNDIKIIWNGETKNIPKILTSCSISWDSIFIEHSGQNSPSFNTHERSERLDIDLAALIYTSGTTGEPKGVMTSHYNMISAARSIIQYLQNTNDDIILNILPLAFGYGLYQVITSIMFGGTVVLEKSFIYMHNVLQRIPEMSITGFPFVPTILSMMLKLQDIEKYNLDSLRYVTNAGAALPIPYIKKFRTLFPKISLYSMYGLTECVRVSYLSPDKIDALPGSAGRSMPNCEVLLINEAGNECSPGETGELVVRGANVMKGYWNAPEKTARVFRQDRYSGETLLYTGDFFKQDDEGYLFFIGRKDDLINCRGERLSAKEIEDIICEKKEVIEAAVIGVPDETLGQAVKAYVSCDKNIQITEKDIIKHCKINLEPFAVPKYVEFVDSLPKTDNGKINKLTLKNEAYLKGKK